MGFNPCFNGSMYKNISATSYIPLEFSVSILVLMDLCIKTKGCLLCSISIGVVSILVLMDLCIKTETIYNFPSSGSGFQSLF